MDSKDTGKEDHLAPTEINQETKDQKQPDANLSHEELEDRLDNYSKINPGEEGKHYFNIQDMKDKYLGELEKMQADHNKGNIHYGMGRREGLPHPDFGVVKENQDKQEQKLRNDVAREAKTAYNENGSLTKSFGEKEQFDKAKGNGMDMDK